MTEPSDGYLLGRGLGPSLRLLAQHYLWKDHFGWNLYPSPQSQNQEAPQMRIADLAVGNAIWLLDEAALHPQNTYVGFDISDSAFPPPEILPGSVSLRVHDATAPVPEEFVGVFDVVHIRLLVAAVRGNDPGGILRNALAMLRPGGMLQWGEISHVCEVLGREGEVTALQGVMDQLSRAMGSRAEKGEHWITKLDETFKAEGLQRVEVVRREPKRWMWRSWAEIFAGAAEEVVGTMGGLGGEAGETLREGARERGRGEFAWCEPRIVVGWKR